MRKTRLFQTVFSGHSGQSRIVRYTLTYAVLSCIWIGFSDRLLLWTVSDPGLLTILSTIKGWFFVAASAVLWYSLMTRSAKKISESQSAYRTLIHASPIPIAVMKIEDGMYLEVNDSFVEMSGYARDEIVGHSILDLGFYPDEEERADILKELEKNGRLRASDRRFRAKSGNIINTLLWVEPISLDGKKYVLALALDLTERKRAEQKLKESELRFSTVFRASPVCISLTRLADGKFLDVNDAFLFLLDYDREEVIGNDPVSLHIWGDEKDRATMISSLRLSGRSEGIETQFRTKSSIIKEVRIIAELIDVMGEKYILGLTEDNTARKKAEAELQRESHRNKMLLKIATDGIHILDVDGNLLEVNDSFCTMLGYSRDELLAMNASQFDIGRTSVELKSAFRSLVDEKYSTKILEAKYRRKDGSVVDVEISTIGLTLEGREIICASARDISGRKMAEQKLIKSEAELIKAQEVAHVGSWKWDITSGKSSWSREMYRIMGVDGKEVSEPLHQILVNAIHPDNRSDAGVSEWSLLRGNGNGRLEYRIVWPDKSEHYIWAEVGELKFGEDGKPALLTGIVQDITERKKAEAELRRVRKAVQTSHEIIFLTDRNGTFTFVNPEFTRVYGYEGDEVIGKSTPRILKSGMMNKKDYEMFWQTLTDGRVIKNELVNKTKDGRLIPAEVSVSPVFGEGGAIDGFLAIQRDITERRRAEELMRKSEEGLAEAQRIVRLGSWEWDSTTGSAIWSRELTSILGREPTNSSPGLQSLLHSPKGSLDRERMAIDLALTIGNPYELELEIARDDGSKLWVSARGEPKRTDDGTITGLRGTVLDITEKKSLEFQLLQAQRMETVGTLSAGIAHDFNNILNIIGGNLRLIAESPHDHKKNRDRTEAITRVTERGAQLVRQLQFFAGKSKYLWQGVEVNKILEENAKIVGETFPKTVAVTLDLAKGLPLVLADPNQLHQVLLNLSVNARDAMPGGGTVCFSTDLVDGKMLRERFQRAQDRPYIKMTVEDTGEGMDKETQRRIFDPFFTTKEVGRGTGLGLSVAHGIVESHGGFFEVESESGKGSAFTIYLPATEEVPVQSESKITTGMLPQNGNETILFIDDEEFGRELAVDQLSEFGYTVLTASSGIEAVEKYRLHMKAISLVLSDFGLPNFDGEEVFKRLRQLNPSVQFILLTGMIDEEKVGKLLQSGIREVILKPYSIFELLTKIREGLDMKQPRS